MKGNAMRVIYSISVALLLSACGRNETPDTTIAPSQPDLPPPTESAMPSMSSSISIQLQPTAGNKASGTLMAAAEGTGVRITGTVMGLTPGSVHGIHIHENGDCSALDASSAGGHFNPLGQQHGAPGTSSHVGDLGNITADAQGNASVNVGSAQATLGGGTTTDITGKAVIVHAQADDLKSQPSGEAGDRIACGVIGGSANGANSGAPAPR
jgi:Cu-Zn family superoxide dismutase